MSSLIVAKTYGCNVGERDSSNRRIKVAYFILESYETFCIDKKSIIVAQLDACNKLLKYTVDEGEGSYSEGNKRIENGTQYPGCIIMNLLATQAHI
jgi:hypothetical protein